MAHVRAAPLLSHVFDRVPQPARERVRAARAHFMMSRRAQSACAAALAVTVAMAVGSRASVRVASVPPHHAPSGTEVVVGRDRRLVTLRLEPPLLAVSTGSRVDLVAQAALLVAGAVVVRASESSVVVAVPAADAPSVATAAALGEVSLVVLPD